MSANAVTPLQQSMFPQPGFYYEGGMTGSHNWRYIPSQLLITSQLLTLGVSSTDPMGNATFTPTVGKTCQYTTGQHTYNVTVAMATPPAPPLLAAPLVSPIKPSLKKHVRICGTPGCMLPDNHIGLCSCATVGKKRTRDALKA